MQITPDRSLLEELTPDPRPPARDSCFHDPGSDQQRKVADMQPTLESNVFTRSFPPTTAWDRELSHDRLWS